MSLELNEWNLASTFVARQELEDCWRRKLEEAQESYEAATKRYHKSVAELHEMPVAGTALQLARHEQTEALMELHRILRIFAGLTLHGRIPEEEESTVKTNGAESEPGRSNLGC